jgi:hypothetical protein
MSKAITICSVSNQKNKFNIFKKKLDVIMVPDNIKPHKAYTYINDRTFTYIYNPIEQLIIDKGSYCLGLADTARGNILSIQSPVPDGTYAIVRVDNHHIEVLSDYTGMRTIWLYHDEEYFIASTSQRMIISFLGNLKLNNDAVRWMLSSGTLGPENSWDKRIKPIQGNTIVSLDRKNWEINYESNKRIEIKPKLADKEWHKNNFGSALATTISNMNIDVNNWKLALSGGKDSRCILYYMKNLPGLKTVTWGTEKSQKQIRGDSAIAKVLAENCGCKHSFQTTDVSSTGFSLILQRFIEAGEGRIDHISGYMDGMQLWKNLFESGHSIIRGYDALGATERKITNERQARLTADLKLTSDYKNSIIPVELEIGEEDLPNYLRRDKTESLSQWRDRLWLNFRTPVVTTALDDIKVAYVEIVNPLLYKNVVEAIEILPDGLRSGKSLFTEIVNEMFPEISYASVASIEDADEILKRKDIIEIMKQELTDSKEKGILPSPFISNIVQNVDTGRNILSFRRKIRNLYRLFAPHFFKKIIERKINYYPMDYRRLALRALIVIRMVELFNNDIMERK